MNEKNLRSIASLTTTQQREIQSKGGKARAEKERQRKALREELMILLSEGKTLLSFDKKSSKWRRTSF